MTRPPKKETSKTCTGNHRAHHIRMLKLAARVRWAEMWDRKVNGIFDPEVSIREAARRVADAGMDWDKSDITIQRAIASARECRNDPELLGALFTDIKLTTIRHTLNELMGWVQQVENPDSDQIQEVTQCLLSALKVANLPNRHE